MILDKLKIFFCFTFLTLYSYSQNSHLKISLNDKLSKEPVANKDITVILNDTITRTLKTNSEGMAIILQIFGGRYKVTIIANGYKTETFKRVGIDGARGRYFNVILQPIKEK